MNPAETSLLGAVLALVIAGCLLVPQYHHRPADRLPARAVCAVLRAASGTVVRRPFTPFAHRAPRPVSGRHAAVPARSSTPSPRAGAAVSTSHRRRAA